MYKTSRSFILFVISFLCFLLTATASTELYAIEGRFALNQVVRDISQLEPTTKVILDGSYLLEVLSRKFIYPKLRIDVSSTGIKPTVIITGSEWNSNSPKLQYPLELYARARSEYFTVKEGFSIISVFANPYIIMLGFSVLMLFIMPKMMANMDQDALKEMQETPAQNPLAEMPDFSAAIANFMSGGNGGE
ncbi:16227_t:CDS:2 [Entrophospora sp. SA101]|nr:16227_t:CDS:2 [Entrophospora sp. SA101]